MNQLDFKKLFAKQNNLSDKEKELLNLFENTLLSRNKHNVFKDEAHKIQMKQSIHRNVNDRKKVKEYFNWLNIAASLTLLISLGIGFTYYNGNLLDESNLVSDTESIAIQLEDGNTQIINENRTSQLIDKNGNVLGQQSGNQLVYNSDVKNDVLVYNTLTVPYGKQFELQLSDGTNVHLNAGTSLKYPVKFVKGKNREVFLNGEAFFNVAKEVNHPFIVSANEIDVRVLGTQFNISSYPEDNHISTVLIEGAVNIYKSGEHFNQEAGTNLQPGFKATWKKGVKQITVEETDTKMYTAWIDGKIIFRRAPFENILKKLERHYNVVIVNNNDSLNKVKFGASFDTETIERVFEILNENYNIDYRIEDNKIIIN
mgnify:CR=1 FL=1